MSRNLERFRRGGLLYTIDNGVTSNGQRSSATVCSPVQAFLASQLKLYAL